MSETRQHRVLIPCLEMPEQNSFEKGIGAAVLACGLYWSQLPKPIALMLVMLFINVLMTAVQKWLQDIFKPKLLMNLGVLSFAGAPLFLWACHIADQGLNLDFHLENWVAYYVTGYAFISIGQRYIKLGGFGAPAIQDILDRVKGALQAKSQGSTMVVTDRVSGPDGNTHTLTIEAPGDTKIIKP